MTTKTSNDQHPCTPIPPAQRRGTGSRSMHMSVVILVVGAMVGLGSTGSVAGILDTGGANALAPAPDRPEVEPSLVVIGFHGAIPAALPPYIQDLGGEVVLTEEVLRFVVVHLDPADSPALIERALADEGVRYAEYNRYVYSQASFTPDDTLYFLQWGPPVVRLPEAWDLTLGSKNINIHILDTGVDFTHLDLMNNTANLDCPYPVGVNMLTFVPTALGSDSGFHGTHVAGIAGAVINNDLGVAGTSQSCLTSVRVLATDRGLSAWVAAGIRWSADNGAHIISMSLGSTQSSQDIKDAVEHADDAEVLIIAAAGNDDCGPVNFPAAYPEVMAVAALAASAARASYSNCGPELDISAPGSNIWSTLPGNTYGPLSGTSMATPLVSGIAALTWGHNTTLSYTEVRCILEETAVNTSPLNNATLYGRGRVDAFEAVKAAIDPATVGCAGA